MATGASREIGVGGFYLPEIYERNQKATKACLENGEIDYADLTQWDFPDEFLCFVAESGLLKFVDSTYPNPRCKNEVPIWFLISCQLVMRLHQTGRYNHLQYLLNSGSLLTRFNFNVGSSKIGFNDKNKNTRKTAVHADTVRKFFKDTKCEDIRSWYKDDLQRWFRTQHAFNHQGLFILDQTHLVVPDNKNYQHAVKMPVDEYGHLYPNLGYLTPEQKKSLVYHPCYTLSTLLNVGMKQDGFHVAGYEFGPGNEDELVQADKLVPDFCRKSPGAMKLLIVDRGYIDGEFIGRIKRDHNVDVLVPLRKNMTDYIEAIEIADLENSWQLVEETIDKTGFVRHKKEMAFTPDLDMWPTLDRKMHAITTRYTKWNTETEQYDVNHGVLVSTKKYSDPKMMVFHYDLRTQTEERFRQFKHSWYITDFPSPNASLLESHICFTLLTYSLLQLYLRRSDLRDMTNKMIQTLRADERLGKDAVVVYAKNHYGVFDLDDYTALVAGMQDLPRGRLKAIMEAQKEVRLKRQYS